MQIPNEILCEIASSALSNVNDIFTFSLVSRNFRQVLNQSSLSVEVGPFRLTSEQWVMFTQWCLTNISYTTQINFQGCNIDHNHLSLLIKQFPLLHSCSVAKCFNLNGNNLLESFDTGGETISNNKTQAMKGLILVDIPSIALINQLPSFSNLIYLGFNNCYINLQIISDNVCTKNAALPSLQYLFLGGADIYISQNQTINSISEVEEENDDENENEEKKEYENDHFTPLKMIETTFISKEIISSKILPLFNHALNIDDKKSIVIDLVKSPIEVLYKYCSTLPKYILKSCSECKDSRGYTPLHESCYHGDDSRVKWLLYSCSARTSIRDGRGATPLFYASQYGNEKCCSLLIKAGAHPILEKNHRMESPVFIASLKGHVNALRELLTIYTRKSSPPLPLMKSTSTAKDVKDSSIQNKGEECKIKSLNALAAEWTPNTPFQPTKHQKASNQKVINTSPSTPPLPSIDSKTMILSTCDADGFSPIHCAVLRRSKSTLDLLLSYGFNVNAQNKYKQTALHLVTRHPSSSLIFYELCQSLIDYGIDINSKDDHGLTALDYYYKHKTNISSKKEKRKEHNTDIDAIDGGGLTSMSSSFSQSSDDHEISDASLCSLSVDQLLRKHGAQLSTNGNKSKNGNRNQKTIHKRKQRPINQ